jgi:CDP-4-dehydro-6-deoxyglucose reductase, E1
MRVPLSLSTFTQTDIDAATAVLESGWLTMGERCAQFEETFARYLGVKHAIFVNSGSSANLLAFFALANPEVESAGRRRMKPGDEVLVPTVTWPTTVWPIVQAGAIPVLIDCDPETLQMCTDDLEFAVSDRTVAICPVHVLGNAVPMKPIRELARKHDLWIVEDTCEALGTRHENRFVGTFSDVATFSFFFSHHISTIEGGMLVTDQDDLGELLRGLRAHGWTRDLRNREAAEAAHPDLDPRYLFTNTGFNVRPTEINAAFGLTQLPRLDDFNRRRVEVAARWNESFAPLARSGTLLPMKPTAGTDPTWFGFPVVCRDSETRDGLREHLESAGIETRPIICGNLARQPAMQRIPHRIPRPLTGADRVMDCGLYWGSHPLMTDDDVDYVARTVRKFFDR